ncbi:hypothetical protein [Haloarchaeobius sp. TZWWS8]|uniref:hypothetical protein n=1 Tax=Haloarchaeobius sp. TZWWS8 TaxID=3446121 RepID=UPI003EBCDDB2
MTGEPAEETPPSSEEPPASGEQTSSSGGPTPPEAVLSAGLDPLLDLARKGTAAVGLPDPSTLANDVLAMPPSERFRESASRYAGRFGLGGLTDPASLDALGTDLPVDAPVQVGVKTVVRNAGTWQGRLLAQLLADPDDPGPYLALVVLLERLERAALAVQSTRETGEGDLAHSLSIVLAVVARLVTLTESDATVDDAVYRDALLASYHLEAAQGSPPATEPQSKSDDEVREIVRLQGALLAYSTFDRPADEVASLTGVPVAQLLAAIDRRFDG